MLTDGGDGSGVQLRPFPIVATVEIGAFRLWDPKGRLLLAVHTL